MLEAAKKAGAAGELLNQRELQQIFQQALNPPKEQAAPKVRQLGTQGPAWLLHVTPVCKGRHGTDRSLSIQ